jgi:ABC-type transport system substrate-binding protein
MSKDDQERYPFERTMTRRNFLGGLALLTGGGLLAACGGDGKSGAPDERAVRQPDGPPRRGGTLIYGVESNPSGFDPARWWNSLSWTGTMAVFDRLVRLTNDGDVVPELAEFEVSRGGTLYTFTLRPGVKFHHGRELTPDDVKYSLERLVLPATGSEGSGLYTGLKIPGMDKLLDERTDELPGIKVIDDRTLTIELEQPDSVLLFVLGLPFASIVPRDVVEEVGKKAFNFAPVGTGPFRMTKVDPSSRIILERNEQYWDPERPYLDRVQWNIGIDPELSILRIQKGEQDLMEEDVPTGLLDQIRNDPSLAEQLFIATENNCYYITLSLKHKALSDVRVRTAVAMAIDKERLVRVLKGLGEPATGGLFSPLSPYYQEGLAHPYDPEQAKALLVEAGYPDGFNVKYYGTNYTPYKEIGETTQQDLGEIGINAELRADVREKWLAEVVKNPPAITMNQWDLPYPHGSYIMDSAFTQAALDSGCCNFSNYVDPAFEELVAKAHSTTDDAERVELYKEMDRIVTQQEVLWVPLFYPKRAFFVSRRLKGYSIPSTPSAQLKFFADYWIEEG